MSEAATTASVPVTPPATPAAPPPNPPAAPVNAPASAPVSAPPAGVISDAMYDSLPVADQDRFSRTRKGVDGGSQWQERATLPSETDPAAKAATGNTPPPPTLVPDQVYQFGDLELKGQEILDLLKHKGETDLRRAAVPADPSQYRIEAKDVVLPPGMDWKFNEADPALAAARNWAHQNELSQEQFSSLLGQYASMESAKENTFRTAMKGELDKLGANATLRVTALQTWSQGIVGPELSKALCAGLFSEKQVRALETIANKMASQGAASFSQAHREPGGQSGRVSEEAYAEMTPGEKYSYSKSFDQKQFR
jgi:hypothetical protein